MKTSHTVNIWNSTESNLLSNDVAPPQQFWLVKFIHLESCGLVPGSHSAAAKFTFHWFNNPDCSPASLILIDFFFFMLQKNGITILLSFICIINRVNGKLVALKVIRLQEEEGTPFTAIREGKIFRSRVNLYSHTDSDVELLLEYKDWSGIYPHAPFLNQQLKSFFRRLKSADFPALLNHKFLIIVASAILLTWPSCICYVWSQFIIPTTSKHSLLLWHGFVTDACECKSGVMNTENQALCCAAVDMQPVLIPAHNILIFCHALNMGIQAQRCPLVSGQCAKAQRLIE